MAESKSTWALPPFRRLITCSRNALSFGIIITPFGYIGYRCFMESISSLAHRVNVVVDAALGGNVFADSEAVQPVQPQIAGMACGEAWGNPHLGHGRQIGAKKLLVAVFAKINDAWIHCQNERAIVGFQGHARVEQGGPVLA